MFKLSCFLLTLGLVAGFAPQSSTTVKTTQLSMSSEQQSRRELFQKTGSAAVIAATSLWLKPEPAQAGLGQKMTEQSAANKANESYQGVYYDPNHPDGYRTIMAVKGSNGKATMKLSDGVPKGSPEEPQTFELPVSVSGNELSFDFSAKGGPKAIKATLSDDKQTLTFEDGNTWTKNFYKYDGIYKVTNSNDPKLSPDAYRILRRNGPKILLEVNDTGNPKDSKFVEGKAGTLFSIPTVELTFYYDGKKTGGSGGPNVMGALYDFQRGNTSSSAGMNEYGGTLGQLSLQDFNTVFPYGTITFADKTVWTRI